MLLRSIPLLLSFSFILSGPVKAQELQIPEWYKWGHNFVSSFAMSIYYTGTDSNKLTADMNQWKYDWLTCFNIVWRSVLFGGVINYVEYSYIPDRAKILPKATIDRYKMYSALLATTSSMITYNSRYEDVIVARYNDTKAYFSGLGEKASAALATTTIALRNVGWFYTLPLLIKPFNSWYLDRLPRQQDLANGAYRHIPLQVVGLAIFSLADLTYKHGLMSLKHTIWQFLPTAQDLRIFRFDDCTTCYFGTNVMGKSGMIGSRLRAARDWVMSESTSTNKEEL